MTQPNTQIDHSEYPKRAAAMTDAELLHTINDCSEALEANPGGHKAGYYADEIHYCGMERASRKKEMLTEFAKQGGFSAARKRAARGDCR